MKDLERIEQRLAGLVPQFKAKVIQLQLLLSDRGVPTRIAQAKRTYQEQVAYWLQGRAPLVEVNTARACANLAPISWLANQRTVTNAKPGQSKHETGEAVDLVPMKRTAGLQRWLPDWASPDWLAIGEAAEELGLEWGGRWGKPDRPHVQAAA